MKLNMQNVILTAAACALGGFGLSPARAAVITQWNFNTGVAANNSPAPSTGSGTATSVGMTGGAKNDTLAVSGDGSLGSTASSDPGSPNDEWRVRGVTNNGWSSSSLTSGAQFTASTAGSSAIQVSFDILPTGGGPRFAQFEYTTDGTNYAAFGSPLDLANLTTPLNVGWIDGVTFDLSGVSGVSNNPNFGFQLLSVFNPTTFTDANGTHAANTAFQRDDQASTAYNPTSGNWRFDMVTVSSTPEPASIGLVGVAALGLLARRRRSAM